MKLRCPECEEFRDGTYPARAIEDLDYTLDYGMTMLTRDLATLTAYNMAAELERFTAALERDLITADDFHAR